MSTLQHGIDTMSSLKNKFASICKFIRELNSFFHHSMSWLSMPEKVLQPIPVRVDDRPHFYRR